MHTNAVIKSTTSNDTDYIIISIVNISNWNSSIFRIRLLSFNLNKSALFRRLPWLQPPSSKRAKMICFFELQRIKMYFSSASGAYNSCTVSVRFRWWWRRKKHCYIWKSFNLSPITLHDNKISLFAQLYTTVNKKWWDTLNNDRCRTVCLSVWSVQWTPDTSTNKKNYFGVRGGGGIIAIVTCNVVFVVNMKISFSPLPRNMHSR